MKMDVIVIAEEWLRRALPQWAWCRRPILFNQRHTEKSDRDT